MIQPCKSRLPLRSRAAEKSRLFAPSGYSTVRKIQRQVVGEGSGSGSAQRGLQVRLSPGCRRGNAMLTSRAPRPAKFRCALPKVTVLGLEQRAASRQRKLSRAGLCSQTLAQGRGMLHVEHRLFCPKRNPAMPGFSEPLGSTWNLHVAGHRRSGITT